MYLPDERVYAYVVVPHSLASLKIAHCLIKRRKLGVVAELELDHFTGNVEPSTLWLLMCSGPCSLPVLSPQQQCIKNAVAESGSGGARL